MDEWNELSEDYKKLDNLSKKYQAKLEEIASLRKECVKGIEHQRYRIKAIKKAKNTEGVLDEEILKREAHLDEIQHTLPRESGTYLKLVLGNVNVSILNKEDKLKYKTDYEKFKLIVSVIAFSMVLLNLAFTFRLLERLYLFLLVWYYCTLTIRESILKLNGSRIKGWWRLHHFISTGTAAVLLIWPDNRTWQDFRLLFMYFNAYLSAVQYLQFRYQSGTLYRLKALGERYNMDITIEGFHQWMWRGLSFLFPFLFSVYFFQFYLACTLYGLSRLPDATWHAKAASLCFFTLSLGNIITTLMVIPDKFTRQVKLKYQVLHQKLHQSWTATECQNKSDEDKQN